MNAQYRHIQPGYLKIIVGLILITIGAIVFSYGLWPLWMPIGAIGIFLFVFSYKLTVEIKDGFLRFWFGPGVFWKNIPLEKVAYCEPFKGVIFGWGIHWGPGGWLYNVSGMKAVTVALKSGKKIHIGTDEPQQLIEAISLAAHGRVPDKADRIWIEAKADYLKRVEQELSTARHPSSFEILTEVGNHLEQRFAELEPQQRTWESFQKIITEMGPPSEYAELVSGDKKTGGLKFSGLELAVVGLLFVIFGVSVYFYPRMPETIVTQWGFHGQPSSSMPKSIGIFIPPVIFAVLVIALIVIPRTASVSVNIKGLMRFYGGMLIMISIVMLLVQYQIILWNLGIKVNPNITVVIQFSAIIAWIVLWFYRAHRQN
jgi:hypothetical protein